MIDAVYALNKLGLKPGMSVSRAISKIGLDLNDCTDPLIAANKIISSFGGSPVSMPIQADIIAKALIEQAIIFGEEFDCEKAYAVAITKFQKIENTMPYVFAGSTEDMAPAKRPVAKEPRGGDKKARALEIYNKERGGPTPRPNGEIATMIAKELDITYANAYYYVSRVFAKYK